MRYFPFLFGFLLLPLFNFCQAPANANEAKLSRLQSVERIAFGSCNDEDKNQSYWNNISATRPDVWIWMGDNVYGDTRDMKVLKKKYDKQANNEYYKKFTSQVPVCGIWDDHDYGTNDGNRTYPKKKESKKLMLDFLQLPDDHPGRHRSGAYHKRKLGDDILLILLDTRSFQDPLIKNPDRNPRYLSSEGDILGKEQWDWLANTLEASTASLHIIVSSIQFLAEEQIYEKWGNFPKAKNKMIELLGYFPEKKCIFLSGDRHIGEISRTKIETLPYTLYDITSSGLTHSYETANEDNSKRIGELISVRNFGILEIDRSGESPLYTVKHMSTSGELLQSHILEFN